MATTAWSTLERDTPRRWLLSNGDVISEPALQESGSGRRVRIRNARQSVPKDSLGSMLVQFANSIAKRKKTTVLLEITDQYRFVPHHNLEPSAQAHLIHDPDNRTGVTQCWWTFQHPALPLFEATLKVTLRSNSSNLHQTLSSALHVPVKDNDYTTDTFVREVDEPTYADVIGRIGMNDWELKRVWESWVLANPAPWPTHVLTDHSMLASPRKGIKALLDIVRAVDDIDTIQVPDARNLTEPSWVDLRLVGTNVNGRFINDLREYLDGTPSVEQALEQYQALLSTLRSMGVDVRLGATTDNDFTAAMLGGESDHVTLEVHNPIGDNGFEIDAEHTLAVHLPSGTMVVECNHKAKEAGDTDAIKQRWDEARLIARMTGEEPALLAYARKFGKDQQKTRVTHAVKDRS